MRKTKRTNMVQVAVWLPTDLYERILAEQERLRAQVPVGVGVALTDTIRAILERGLRDGRS